MRQVLEDLGEKLFGGFGLEDGLSESAVVAGEKRLGVSLPPTIREFLKLVGNHPVVMTAHARLLRPHEMYVLNGALVFAEENQSVMFWAFMLGDQGSDAPPVWQGNSSETKWHLDAELLSSFLLGVLGWQAAFGLPNTARAELDEQLANDLESRLTRCQAGRDTVVDLVTFYDRELVVSVSPAAGRALIGATSERLLREFEETYDTGLDWL